MSASIVLAVTMVTLALLQTPAPPADDQPILTSYYTNQIESDSTSTVGPANTESPDTLNPDSDMKDDVTAMSQTRMYVGDHTSESFNGNTVRVQNYDIKPDTTSLTLPLLQPSPPTDVSVHVPSLSSQSNSSATAKITSATYLTDASSATFQNNKLRMDPLTQNVSPQIDEEINPRMPKLPDNITLPSQPAEDGTWKCPICDKAMSSRYVLAFHIGRHDGLYPFKCQYCGKGFASRYNMRGHMAQHTQVKEFKCSLCSCEYVYKKDLVRHLVKRHGLDIQSRQLQC